MKLYRRVSLFVLLILSVYLLSFCKKNKIEDPAVQDQVTIPDPVQFARQAMITNYADNIITPALQKFALRTDTLNTAVQHFVNSSDVQTLNSLIIELDKTWIAWQYCGLFRYKGIYAQFGAIDELNSRKDEYNIFPVSYSAIEGFITDADFSFENQSYNARGLNTVDYLINNQEESDSVTIQKFVTSQNRKKYLQALISRMKTRANTALNVWNVQIVDYLLARGTDTASAASITSQFLANDLENITDYKIGIPVGRILGGSALMPYPEKVEAFYSGKSILYLKHNIKALENAWYGRDINGIDRLGFEDYLLASGNTALAKAINDKFESVQAKTDALPNTRLSMVISQNNDLVKAIYLDLKVLNGYFKNDLPSALGLTLDYTTGDGD